MNELAEAIKLIQKEMQKEYGENAKLEDGDSIIGVFNDCVIKLENENNETKVEITVGKPYIFDLKIFDEEVKDE